MNDTTLTREECERIKAQAQANVQTIDALIARVDAILAEVSK